MQLRKYSARVYRNFATSIESQDLTDDLTNEPLHREILNTFFYTPSSGPQKSPIERVLEKSEDQIVQEEIDAKFRPSLWFASRYSDGSWAVLYAAESEETALHEVLFHLMDFYREELLKTSIEVQRRVLSLNAKSDRAVDLGQENGLDRARLLSPDESGYPYCQDLAQRALGMKAQLIRAPSARHDGGFCTPIFDKSAVTKDEGHLKYLRCTLNSDGNASVTALTEETTKKYKIVGEH